MTNYLADTWRWARASAFGRAVSGGRRPGVEQQRREVDGGDAIDHGMVDLVDHRHPAAAQALDDGHLPQRLVQVERPREDARGVIAQGGFVSPARQRSAPDVIREGEVLIVDPNRVAQVARQPHYLLAGAGDDVPS